MIFEPFPKIPRLRRECTITEKIDGTNAAIVIAPIAEFHSDVGADIIIGANGEYGMAAQSRTRFIVPGNDNFGFASWACENAAELFKLGEGRHFGEWYGAGIQRRYGLDHKRFALFNVDRWADTIVGGEPYISRPLCCDVVPVLYRGPFSDDAVTAALGMLRTQGSYASPLFMNPEGIVVWMHASRTMHKVTLEKDEKPKGSTE